MMTWGCARPIDNTRFVIVEPGDPIQNLSSNDPKNPKVIVTGSTLKGGNLSKQDISGWISMPPSHWRVISEQLEKDKTEGRLK